MKRGKTPTFLVELPLATNEAQAKPLRAHLEAARCLYNALLGEAMKRLHLMRADSRWQEARRLPKTCKQQRNTLFSSLRKKYCFSEYALHDYAKTARCHWIADHIDSTMAQTLATRAYQAANRVCLGQARRVRFRSRGLDSVEGKRNDTGLRFVLQALQEGNAGHLVWGKDRIPTLIDWDDSEFEALQQARAQQETQEFRDTYAARSGIEGTHSEARSIPWDPSYPLLWLG